MIDFFGSGYDVAELMGLLPALTEAAYDVDEIAWIDNRGHTRARLSYEAFKALQEGRVCSFMRGDLERALYHALPRSVDVRFAATVTQVQMLPTAVNVTLETGEHLDADLLVAADGIHSRCRSLAFGPEQRYYRYLGYHVAAFTFEDDFIRSGLGRRFVLLSVPRREVGLYSIRGNRVASVFIHTSQTTGLPKDPVKELQDIYGDLAWFVPQTLTAAKRADSIYFDNVAQIEMEAWHRRRVVLVGDAGYAVSLLAGQGASLAMAGAFLLAKELRAAATVDRALARYSLKFKQMVAHKQAAGRKAAKWILPTDALHLLLRNWTLRLAEVPGLRSLLYPILRDGSESIVDRREHPGPSLKHH